MLRSLALALVALLLVAPAVALVPSDDDIPDRPPLADPVPSGATGDASKDGVWGAPFEGKVPAISMALLPDGRVLYWGGIDAHDHDNVFFFEHVHDAPWALLDTGYDAAAVTVGETQGGMRDLFCSGHTILADGRILTGGGSYWRDLQDFASHQSGFVDGIKDSWAFDPATSSWERQPDMATDRWYPTLMTRADGSALAASGIQRLPQPQTHNTLLETFDGEAWSNVEGADRLLPMYPRLFTVPSGPMKGEIFYATSGTLWGPFGERPDEAQWSLEQAYDPETNAWRFLGPSVFGARQHAATVVLPLDPADDHRMKVLTFGGSIGRSVAATNTAEMTILPLADEEGIAHAVMAPLRHARWQVNGVLLPDGTVLAVGGGLYDNVYVHGQPVPPVLVAEQFDPRTGQWSDRAAMTVPRMYHSTALLLPDGRVLVGGHVPLPVPWTAFRDAPDNLLLQDQVVETRFEIYEPNYLHQGVARPVIAAAPASVAYGAAFAVEAADASGVQDAILVRPGTTTHAWDSSQRAIVLPVEGRSGNTLTFQAPPDGDVAAPGPWMLFLRTAAPSGVLVPSVAAFLDLEASP